MQLKIIIIQFFVLSFYVVFGQSLDTTKIQSSFSTNAIIIQSDRIQKNSFPQSIEETLRKTGTITLINRGSVAMEPGIYGFSMGPVSLSLDGVSIQGACVDHMDPGSSYIEPENLKQIGINREEKYPGFTNETIGNIDFVTEKPNFDFVFRLRSDNSFSSNSAGYKSGTVIDYSLSNFAYRGSFTVRQGNDYKAAKNELVSNSNFLKYNAKQDFQYNLDNRNSVLFSYLYDNSPFTGFPSLIMDATGATASIMSLSFLGTGLISNGFTHQIKLFNTTVTHKMDDYARSVQEIKTRLAMPNMYMPMTGENKSFGIQARITSPIHANKSYSFGLELKKTSAIADMRMIPLVPAPEMYLYNIGDVDDFESNFSGSYISRSNIDEKNGTLSINYGLNFISRKINNQDAINAIRGFDSDVNIENSYFLPKIVLSYQNNGPLGLRYEAIAKFQTRAPLAVDSYGYYLFSPLDNYYYMGNSKLKTEKSGSIKLTVTHTKENYDISASTFCYYFMDYIIGKHNLSLPTIYNVGFKQYGNFGNAYYAGLEIYGSKQFDFVTIDASAKYHTSRSIYFNDQLPFTSPVSGAVNVIINLRRLYFEANFNWSLPSNDYSRIISDEHQFSGETEFNIVGSYEISEQLTMYVKCLNLFDQPNKSRFSVNNLMLPGLNIQTGINLYFAIEKEEI